MVSFYVYISISSDSLTSGLDNDSMQNMWQVII